MAGNINEIISKAAVKGIQDADKNITSLDNNIVKFIGSIDKLADSMKKGNVTFKELQTQQKKTATTAKELTDEQKKLETIEKSLSANTDKVVKARIEAAAKTKEQKAKITELIAAEKRESGSIDALRAANKKLTAIRNKTTAATEAGRKKIDQINKKLDQNNQKIKQNSDALAKQKQNIGNYKSALGGVSTKLIGMASAMGLTVGAMAGLKEIISSTQAVGDEFAYTFGGLKESFSFLARSIATMDFTNLIQGFRDAYLQGRQYAIMLDEIADRSRALGIQKLDIEGEILAQRVIAKNTTLELSVREAAINEIIRLEQKKLDKTLEVTGMALKNELELSSQISGLREDEVKDFVKNYDIYSDKIAEGAELQAELNDLKREGQDVYSFDIADMTAYNERMAELTDEQKENIRLATMSNLLTDERRDAVAGALSAEITANNELQRGKQKLILLEVQLYNELIRTQKAKGGGGTVDVERNAQAEIQTMTKATTEILLIEYDIRAEAQIAATEYTQERLAQLSDEELEAFKAREKEKAEIRKAQQEERIGIAQASTAALSSIGDAYFQHQSQQLTEQSAQFAQQKAYELQMADGNQAQINAINEKYAKKEAALKKKQAENDRKAAIFRAIINIATAILTMIANTGGPAGFVTAAVAAAVGAFQLATIASTPIPQFFKGGDVKTGGVISVGEKGRELIDKNGQLFMATNPALMSGMEGAKIYSNPETERILAGRKDIGYDSADLRSTLTRNNDRLIKTIKNKRELHINPVTREITERKGNNWKTYKNRYFS